MTVSQLALAIDFNTTTAARKAQSTLQTCRSDIEFTAAVALTAPVRMAASIRGAFEYRESSMPLAGVIGQSHAAILSQDIRYAAA